MQIPPKLQRVSSKSAGSTASTTPPFRRVVCVINALVPQGRLRHQRSAGSWPVAQKPWGGPPSCDPAPLTTSFGTVGQWERRHRAMVERTKGRRPKNRPSDTKGRRPKNRPAKGETLEATWVRGEGTQEPRRRGAADFLPVVAATACATVTTPKPTPLGMGCLWSAWLRFLGQELAYLFAYQGIPDPASCRACLRRGGSVPEPTSSSLKFVLLDPLSYSSAPGPFGDRGDMPRWGPMAGSAAWCTPYIRCCPFFPVQSQPAELPATTVGESSRGGSL